MKNKLFILTAVLASLSLASCKKVEPVQKPEPTISVVKSELAISGKGGEAVVEVEAKGSFSASVDKSWLNCRTEGTKIILSATENKTLESRYATLLIKDAQENIELTVQQFGLTTSGFMPDDINVKVEGGSVSYQYKYDDMLVASTDADWITLEVTADKLNVTIEENTTEATLEEHVRTAVINWSLGVDNGTIQVTQKHLPFLKVDDNWSLEYLGYDEDEGMELIQNNVEDYTLSGFYGISYFSKKKLAASGESIEDYVFNVVAPEFVEAAEKEIDFYEQDDIYLEFLDFLFEDSDVKFFKKFRPGDYYAVAIGFNEDATLSGHFAYSEFKKEGSGGAYPDELFGKWICPDVTDYFGDSYENWTLNIDLDEKGNLVINGFDIGFDDFLKQYKLSTKAPKAVWNEAESTLTVENKTETGIQADNEPVIWMGMDSNNNYCDIVFDVDLENGEISLSTEMFGAKTEADRSWYSLYSAPLKFVYTDDESTSSAAKKATGSAGSRNASERKYEKKTADSSVVLAEK